MRICVYSGLDINGQANLLCEEINRRPSGHSAANVVARQSYLSYPCDQIVSSKHFREFALQEDFDFYILRWLPTDFIYDLVAEGIVSKSNCILRLHGSEVRSYPYRYFGLWAHTGLTMVSNGYDFQLNHHLGFVLQHIPPMMDCEYLWRQVLNAKELPRDTLVVGHAPTDPQKKGTEYLKRAVDNMRAAGLPVELKLIMNRPWAEAVKEKAHCHAIFDQISQDIGIGTFGVNLLEALAQSKVVLGDPHDFTYSMYPALKDCMVRVDPQSLEYQLRAVCSNKRLWQTNGLHLNPKGWEFVRSTFDAKIVASQWLDLIRFIHEGGARK